MVVQKPLQIVAANTYCRTAVAGRDVIIVGDAAMAGDPLAGEGVTWAVRSGVLAADIAMARGQQRETGLETYSNAVSDRFMEFLAHRAASYRRVERWRTSEFWSRRH